MATVSIYLDKRRIKDNGEYPLKFNISIDRKRHFLIPLKFSIKEHQWDGTRVIKHPEKNTFNCYIRERHNQITKELLNLEMSGAINAITVEKFKFRIETIFKRSDGDPEYLVKDHFEYFMNFKDKRSTREVYEQTLFKLQSFADIDSLSFDIITPAWLREFEQHMKKQGLSINSISIHMRNLRAIFNDAINNDRIDQNLYPFRKFKVKTEKTVKRSLTHEELRTLRDYQCEPHQQRYIDLFMLIFYLQGINIIDLCNLKEIKNGRIEYRRAKTGRLYSVRVEPETQLLLDKYKGTNYLINILDTYSDYRDFRHRMNKNLQQIGEVKYVDRKNGRIGKKEIIPKFPNITTYYARHTWATIAASLDIPKETIAATLGHGGNTVTDIYINFDQRKIDEANRQVLDCLSNNVHK